MLRISQNQLHLLISFLAIFLVLPSSVRANSELVYNPDDDTRPVTRESNSERSDCGLESNGLTLFQSITPNHILSSLDISENDQRLTEITNNSHPTFWFYIPSEAESATLSLLPQNQDLSDYAYEKQFTEIRPGVFAFTLPETDVGLNENMLYEVRLEIGVYLGEEAEFTYCDTVSFIQRRATDAVLISSTSSVQGKAKLYAESGFWNDAVTILGRSVCNRENVESWRALLTQPHFEGFEPFQEEIVNSPISNCSTANSPLE